MKRMDAGGVRMVAKTVRVGCGGVVAALGLVLSASPALAAGTLNVDVVGRGTVTSDDGAISCSQAGEATCSHAYSNELECDSGRCVAIAPSVTLTATPGSGFTFGSWSGCTSMSSTSCTVFMS